MSGTVYIVATPIGNLSDITLRAIETLKQVDYIIVEDKRHSQRLLNHLNIQKPLVTLHKFNEKQQTDKYLNLLKSGQSMALISDAGTPLISDPGESFVAALQSEGIRVSPIPGCCAAIAALSCSGLSTDSFRFYGFLPAKEGAREARLNELKEEAGCQVFYEAPHRIKACVHSLLKVLGEERQVTLAREMTKIHETILTTTLGELLNFIEQDHHQEKGEIVLIVSGYQRDEQDTLSPLAKKTLALLLPHHPLKQAAALAAEISSSPKQALYRYGLSLKGEK